jgi:hypothetical protein
MQAAITGIVMLKSISAVLAAAAAAATLTLMSAPAALVTADPIPQAASAGMKACAERPWPYARCVGTEFGKPGVRLVTTENLGG